MGMLAERGSAPRAATICDPRAVTAAPRASSDSETHGGPTAGVGRVRTPDRPWYRYADLLLPTSETGPWVDLGCGLGELLERAAARGLRGIGLDLSRDDAGATRRSGRPALVADLSRPLPFADASLAGAAIVEVIEHVFEAESLAAELARVIRPGGWLVLTTPNVAHLTYRWRALTGHVPKQEGYHLRFFTKKALVGLLDAAGFERVETASFGKQSLLTKLLRPFRGRGYKHRYRVPPAAESLLAQHFVWRLVRRA